MQHPYNRHFRINFFIVLLTGLFIMAVSIAVIFSTLQNLYGQYSMSELLPFKSEKVLGKKTKTAAILYTKYTEAFYPDGSAWLSESVNTWKKYVEAAGYSYRMVEDRDIEIGKHYYFDLLILPSASAMSEAEAKQIEKFIERGGSVLVTGNIAAFKDDGTWRGWDFMNRVLALGFTRELSLDEISRVLTLRGGLALTSGLPTGYSLKVATWDHPIACEVLEPRTKSVSFWHDFRREVGVSLEDMDKSVGIACGEFGKGRFVWLGFDLNSVMGTQKDYINFDRFLKNALNWLTKKPTLILGEWPTPYRAAAVFTTHVNDSSITHMDQWLETINKHHIPVTFFVDPVISQTSPKLIESLKYRGDIGVIADVGFVLSDETPIVLFNDYQTQLYNVQRAKKDIEDRTGLVINGVYPRYGAFNDNSLRAFIKAGFKFTISDSIQNRAVPEILNMNGKSVTAMGRIVRDDRELIERLNLTDHELQLFTFKEEMERVLSQGGLYIANNHAHLLNKETIAVYEQFYNHLKQKKVWVTSLRELTRWWETRGSLYISLDERSLRRLSLVISNNSEEQINNLVFQVNINKTVEDVRIHSDIYGTPIPAYTFQAEAQTLEILIDLLKKGETRTYFIDYREVEEKPL